MGNAKKILIVEDELPMQKVLSDTFNEQGFSVLQSSNGQEALAIALNKKPDIILLDILMPKMDGITMLQKLREDAWGKKAKVIVLTNVNAESDKMIKAIVDNQPSYYLIKSDVKLDDIVDKVNEVLETT